MFIDGLMLITPIDGVCIDGVYQSNGGLCLVRLDVLSTDILRYLFTGALVLLVKEKESACIVSSPRRVGQIHGMGGSRMDGQVGCHRSHL